MAIFVVIVVVLIIGGLIFLYYDELIIFGKSDYVQIINDSLEIQQSFMETIPKLKVTESADATHYSLPGKGNGITIEWNMKLDNPGPGKIWNTSYSKNKPILRIGDSPHIYYNPKLGILRILVSYKETDFNASYPVIELKDVPTNKWVNYIVVIDDNKVRVYVNRELVISKELPNELEIDYDDILIGEVNNNIAGSLGNMKLHRRALTNTEIIKANNWIN